MQLFYRPELAAVGDIIPFHDGKHFRIFYLRNYRNNMDKTHHDSWAMVTTDDQLHFEESDTFIDAATGSVVYDGTQYHMFATIFKSRPMKNYIIHVTSPDLVKWTMTDDQFYPDGEIYEDIHWRDPFVFRCEEENCWWMVLAARSKGPTNRRACVGLCKSDDLKNWRYCSPIYNPSDANCAFECPDYFKWGDWYYLVFSSYSDRFQTLYRMSRSPVGPWIAPECDTFDTRAFYAAKTASDGNRRFVYGWNPTREIDEHHFSPQKDFGCDQNTWDWGGNMIIHELIQMPDGTLRVKPCEAVDRAPDQPVPIDLRPVSGSWKKENTSFVADASNGYCAALLCDTPEQCRIHFDVSFSGNPVQLGAVLCTDDNFAEGYYAVLEPGCGRIQYKTAMRCSADRAIIFPFTVEMERPIHLQPEVLHRVTIFRDHTVLVIYVDDTVALSTRMYSGSNGQIGLFTEGENAVFSNVTVTTLPEE